MEFGPGQALGMAARLLRDKKPGSAARHFLYCLERGVGEVAAQGLCEACVSMRDQDKSQAYLLRGHQLDPRQEIVATTLAAKQLEQGKPFEALRVLEETLAVSVASAPLLYWRGMALRDAGRTLEGIVTLRRAVKIQPDHYPALLELGTMLVMENRGLDRAVELLSKAHEASPDEPGALIQLGQCLFKQGKRRTARKLFKTALALNPRDELALFSLYECYTLARRPDLASRIARRLVRLAPAEDSYRQMLFQSLSRSGQFKVLADDCLNLLKSGLENRDALLNLRLAYHALGEKELAAQCTAVLR